MEAVRPPQEYKVSKVLRRNLTNSCENYRITKEFDGDHPVRHIMDMVTAKNSIEIWFQVVNEYRYLKSLHVIDA